MSTITFFFSSPDLPILSFLTFTSIRPLTNPPLSFIPLLPSHLIFCSLPILAFTLFSSPLIPCPSPFSTVLSGPCLLHHGFPCISFPVLSFLVLSILLSVFSICFPSCPHRITPSALESFLLSCHFIFLHSPLFLPSFFASFRSLPLSVRHILHPLHPSVVFIIFRFLRWFVLLS